MRFFYPTPVFWEFMERHRHRFVVEVGCGDGDLLREMHDAGYRALGVDPRFSLFGIPVPTDLRSSILDAEIEHATAATSRPSTLLLVCRPCHSGFPRALREVRHPDSVLAYIGFGKNLDVDMGQDAEVLETIEGAGRDDEIIHIIK